MIDTNKTTPTHEHYAGFWWRFLAFIIDSILLGIASNVIQYPITILMDVSNPDTSTAVDAFLAVGVLISFSVSMTLQWLYFTLMESSEYQATLGKKWLGMTVTDMEGNRIGFGRANGRYFAKIISAMILFIGYIMIAFTERKQGLHDLIAGTLVMKQD